MIASGIVQKDTVGLCILHIQASAGHQQIEPAIVVQIHQSASPAAPTAAQIEQSCLSAAIFELAFALIEKHAEGLILQPGHNDIRPAIAIDIAKVSAHSR